MRGLAIATVLVGHAFEPTIPGAPYVGVDLFFVLSGYLITTVLLSENDRRHHIDLPRFYARRALRLLPALYALLAVYGVFALLGSADERTTRLGAVLAALLYVSNVAQAWTIVHPSDLQHTWSLALEEQFYLVWPLALRLMLRHERGLRHAAVALATTLVAVLAGRWYLAHINDVFGDGLYFSPVVWADALVIGCLLAVAIRARWIAVRTPSAGLLVIAAVVLLSVCRSGAGQPLVDGGITLVALASAVLVLAAVDGGGPVAELLRRPILVWLGELSYALYLWHYVVLGWLLRAYPSAPRALVGAVVIVISIGLAVVSGRLVERPFLRMKSRFAA